MLFNAIGLLGVVMILVTYGLVQVDRIDVKGMRYSFFNAFGALLILISLYVNFNLSAFVIELSWLLISIFGILNAFKRKRKE